MSIDALKQLHEKTFIRIEHGKKWTSTVLGHPKKNES